MESIGISPPVSPAASFRSVEFSPNTSFGSTDMSTDVSLGYDFEDNETRAQLELIDDLRKVGVSDHIGLPQLVVVGDQSTGKSSVLQAVTDIPFPINDEMCTRFATEIVLQRTSSDMGTKVKFEIIPATDESPDRQKALKEWHPKGVDSNAELNKSTMEYVFDQAENMIFDNTFNKRRTLSRLSSSTLRITRTGPKETNFAIVDIPGLIRGNDSLECRTAKQLVQRYLDNPLSIIVQVIDVVDMERQENFPLLEKLPDRVTRVIGVINKCDTKQKKSHEWVFDLIRNDPKSKHYLREGWYGLRNRQASELEISDEERDKNEKSFFSGQEWASLDPNKLGRHHLKKALIQMRNRHVKQSIPGILGAIQVKLDECNQKIDRLGEPRTDNQAQFTLVNRVAARYSAMAEGALNGHYEILSDEKLFARKLIRDDLEAFQEAMATGGLKVPFSTSDMDTELLVGATPDQYDERFMSSPIYAWISSAIKDYRGKEEIGEVNPEVKDQLWKKQTASWQGIASQALDNVEKTIDSVNAVLFQEACPDGRLRPRLQIWLQDGFRKISAQARVELQHLIENELHAHLFTLHPQKKAKQNDFHSSRVSRLTERLNALNGPQAQPGETKVKPFTSENIVSSHIYQTPALVGVFNTHDSLAAYYDVALCRFIDNFALQVVERHLLGPSGPLRLFNPQYVAEKLYGPKNAKALSDLADEDPETAQERAKLEAQRASLEDGKIRVQNFKVL